MYTAERHRTVVVMCPICLPEPRMSSPPYNQEYCVCCSLCCYFSKCMRSLLHKAEIRRCRQRVSRVAPNSIVHRWFFVLLYPSSCYCRTSRAADSNQMYGYGLTALSPIWMCAGRAPFVARTPWTNVLTALLGTTWSWRALEASFFSSPRSNLKLAFRWKAVEADGRQRLVDVWVEPSSPVQGGAGAC